MLYNQYMRLYLSSYKFGEHTDELVRLAGKNKRVAVIMNAVDFGDPDRAALSLDKQVTELRSLGFEAEKLDLREYFSKSGLLEERMAHYAMVWVHGGNSFLLKRAYEQSGFDKILKKLLDEDEIIYAGFSAAIVVITPTLRGIEIVDDPNVVPEPYKKEIDLNGLGIIDYVVAVHYKSDHPESEQVDKYVAYCEKEGIPYKTLKDGEVIVVDGDTEKVLS